MKTSVYVAPQDGNQGYRPSEVQAIELILNNGDFNSITMRLVQGTGLPVEAVLSAEEARQLLNTLSLIHAEAQHAKQRAEQSRPMGYFPPGHPGIN